MISGKDQVIAEPCFDNSRPNFLIVSGPGSVRQIQEINTSRCLVLKDKTELSFSACDSPESSKFKFFLSHLNPELRNIKTSSGDCLSLENGHLTVDTCSYTSSNQNFLISQQKSHRQKVPKIIWTFWDKGESKMPDFYRVNVEKWKDVLGSDWEIKVIDAVEDSENNYKKFISPESLPTQEWLSRKISGRGPDEKIKPAVVFSDFLRLELLYKYGGVWSDPSIMLHRDLQQFTTPLELFVNFEIAGYTTKHQAYRDLLYLDSLENFFLVAVPKAEVTRVWKTNFRRYWDLKKINMPAAKNPLFKTLKGRAMDTSAFGGLSNYLNQHLALKFTLEDSPKLRDNIYLLGDTSDEENGPFTLVKLHNWNDTPIMNLSEEEQSHVLQRMQGVAMSKFASENSIHLRQKNKDYFFDRKNIFGKINGLVTPRAQVQQRVNPHVWTFWDKGEQAMPAFNRFNVIHWRKLLKPLGYQITVVNLIPGDPNNLETLLGDRKLLPSNWDTLDSLVVTYQSPDGGWTKMVPSVVRSDFARLALLEKFGGIWMDSSNVLLKDLDTIVVNALDLSTQFEVGGYVMDSYSSQPSPIVNGVKVDGMGNWFIAAKAHSPLIRKWREAFSRYWTTRKPGQQIHEHPMYSQAGFNFGEFGTSRPNYLNQHAALKYVLFREPELGQKILPIKHMQPWWFHTKVGGSPAELYRGFISPHVEEYAREILEDNVELLKFAGPHLTEINAHFRHLKDFCTDNNLLRELYRNCPVAE